MAKKDNILDKNFYIDKIEVLNWLKSEDNTQEIRFKNRFEYKSNNKLHREDGPAIDFFDGVGNQFYINGDKYTSDEFTNYKRNKLIDKIYGEI